VAVLAQRPDVVDAGGAVGYSRALGVASPAYIREHYAAYGGPKPPPLDPTASTTSSSRRHRSCGTGIAAGGCSCRAPIETCGLTRVAPDGRYCDHKRPLVNAGRWAEAPEM